MQLLQQFPQAVLLAWFPESQLRWQSVLEQTGISRQVMLARSTSALQLANKTIILLEHYPIASKEETFLQSLQQQEIYVLGSLDEPIFSQFGGERIIDMMRRMGIREDEPVQHKLITQSLQNAQRKLEKKVTMEQTSHSMKEWFVKNIK